MKAIRIRAPGRPLELQDVDTPVPAAGEVVVAVKAAGICHSDAHYRAGVGTLGRLPLTPGHEVAGVIEAAGPGVSKQRIGERVCLHYLQSCGVCTYCKRGIGQFCADAAMIGKDVDGGYAEYIAVPQESAIPLPDAIPFSHGAVMMCSFATSLHALRKSRFAAGESIAIFGAGGLGIAAVALARALGASTVFAVDVNAAKVKAAEAMGAVGIDASTQDAVQSIAAHTSGAGVDVALELVGQSITTQHAVRVLGVQGRAAVAGLANVATELDMYRDLIGKESEIIGVSDHLPDEIDELLEMATRGRLDIAAAISDTIPLEASAINKVFDDMDAYRSDAIRTVIEMA